MKLRVPVVCASIFAAALFIQSGPVFAQQPPVIVEQPAPQPYPQQGQQQPAPQPYPPQGQPAYPTQPYVYVQPYPQPPAQVYIQQPGYGQPTPQQLATLSDDDRELLLRGEYSSGEVMAGGLLAILLGFGSGQAVQGRWTEIGWLFTFGEIAGLVVAGAGAASCANDFDCSGGYIIGGVLGFVILHIWEVIDAFAVPASRNSRLRRLEMQFGIAPLYSAGSSRPTGTTAGLSLRF